MQEVIGFLLAGGIVLVLLFALFLRQRLQALREMKEKLS
jgi:hypothetical protein